MGIVERSGETVRVPLTVFYPTAQAEQPHKKGPFDLSLAVNAQPESGPHPLVVISHGSGGSPWVHVDLARTLVNNGFLVGMPAVPLGLILARQDINQIPRFHGLAVQRICKTCTTVADLPQAGHGVMLSPLPPLGATDSIAFQLLSDPPGFERKQLHALHQKVADFFKQHLTRP